MPDWGAWLLVAVAGWVIFSTLLGISVGRLFARIAIEPQPSMKADRPWRLLKRPVRETSYARSTGRVVRNSFDAD